MRLWHTWGLGMDFTGKEETEEEGMGKENRWRRAWILAQSRRGVRKWVEEREKGNGKGR